MFVGDALGMPVHWYYDVAALHRDFGMIRDYQAPKDFHPNSIIALASTARAGCGSQEGEVVGGVILEGALGEFLRAEGFEWLREADEPLIIREQARKYQYIVTHAMLCRRVRNG
jgi:hypothetical protein